MNFYSPCNLIDCPYCDGTNWPDESFCHFCKRQIVTDEELKRKEEIEKQIERDDKKRYDQD